jgi:pimeloyl-ACP methyl ester carboxylesterase
MNEINLAVTLAEAGHDVWLSNNRGYVLNINMENDTSVSPQSAFYLFIIIYDFFLCLSSTLLFPIFTVWFDSSNVFSRAHTKLTSWESAFWDWCIDEHALDVEANIRFIFEHTGKSVAYIGHSNGSAQGLAALSSSTDLQKLVCHLVLMSPAAFVNKFESRALQFMAWMHCTFPSIGLMSLLFGKHAFFAFMEPTRSIVGIRIFSVRYCS